jgi:hypothetical protein
VNESRILKRIAVTFVVVIGVVGLFLLAHLWLRDAGFISLPDEERYQYINSAKDGLDLERAGEVVDASYFGSEGLGSYSVFGGEVRSPDAFAVLSDRVQKLPGVNCPRIRLGQVKCYLRHVEITITESAASVGTAEVHIMDVTNGRGYR